jgi:hypothetical protein
MLFKASPQFFRQTYWPVIEGHSHILYYFWLLAGYLPLMKNPGHLNQSELLIFFVGGI